MRLPVVGIGVVLVAVLMPVCLLVRTTVAMFEGPRRSPSLRACHARFQGDVIVVLHRGPRCSLAYKCLQNLPTTVALPLSVF